MKRVWLAVIVGALLFGALVVWLYTLLGYAVVIPLLIAGAAYFEIRLSGIIEQIDALLELPAPRGLLCGQTPPESELWLSEGPYTCTYPLGHLGEWHRADDGMMWRHRGQG